MPGVRQAVVELMVGPAPVERARGLAAAAGVYGGGTLRLAEAAYRRKIVMAP
jgi:hypothetical protein